ncbi:MAG: hypothetical protein HRT90_00750 [Candidatus Margulisbacteria bacterium]|nr:hypothetical protein [Candidatus Margulisiibacteriota bacterium]
MRKVVAGINSYDSRMVAQSDLKMALFHDKESKVMKLLSLDVDINQKFKGLTILQLCLSNKWYAVANYLLESPNINLFAEGNSGNALNYLDTTICSHQSNYDEDDDYISKDNIEEAVTFKNRLEAKMNQERLRGLAESYEDLPADLFGLIETFLV